MIRPSRQLLRRALFATVILGAVGAALSASPMRADTLPHLKLLRSSPTADTTLTSSPDAIRLWLSEPTELPASKIALATAKGDAIATDPLARGAEKDAPLTAKLKAPLTNGVYQVTWKAMSKDGHVVNGTFKFTVAGAR
jgi:methionine-rich copper-binding protein CopC